ncbi:MAG: hypothetical protein AABZ47_07260, partial [Planctomycetota bacterium]
MGDLPFNITTRAKNDHVMFIASVTGLDRLVLASGGVARDFLAILRRAVTTARERGDSSSRGERAGQSHLNLLADDLQEVIR